MMFNRLSSARRPHAAALLVALLWLVACGRGTPPLTPLGTDAVLLAFGDSLTYGIGANPEDAYPAVLERLIGRTVVNAGIPGETTAEGLERLPAALDQHQPALLLLCLGGNDMLRQQPGAGTAANLRRMVELARDRGVAVVLIGVPEPRLFSGAPEFYRQIATEFSLPYEGEIMNTVLKDARLKSDPIHANAAGYQQIAAAVAALLRAAGAL